MSSCLTGGGGGRTYGFDLDAVKTSPSLSRSSHSSSPSSILSESSNSALVISIKKARTPRKRLNQTYNEAAALLSAIYPTVFPTKSQKHLSKITKPLYSFPETPALLPSLPVLSDSAFLIHRPPPDKPISAAALSVRLKHKAAVERECTSPVSNVSWEANSTERSFEDELNAESILDEEVEKGIDTIMGNLRMDVSINENSSEGSSSCGYSINPLLRSLVGCQIGDRLELGVGFGFPKNLQRALRKRDEDEWWRSPVVPMRNIIPNYKPALDKKHNKKKANKKEVLSLSVATSTCATSEHNKLKPGLGLKLNHEQVLKEWSDRGGAMFTNRPDSPNSYIDTLTRLADIDLFPDSAIDSDAREASILKYKDKQRTRLYSKKILYQVRKVNAECRPRTKGRFLRKPSPLSQTKEEES